MEDPPVGHNPRHLTTHLYHSIGLSAEEGLPDDEAHVLGDGRLEVTEKGGEVLALSYWDTEAGGPCRHVAGGEGGGEGEPQLEQHQEEGEHSLYRTGQIFPEKSSIYKFRFETSFNTLMGHQYLT